jgi:hypothetical protein
MCVVRAYFGTMCSNFDALHQSPKLSTRQLLAWEGESPASRGGWVEIRSDSLSAVFGKSQPTRLGALVANCSSCGLPGRVSWSLA